MKGLQRIFGDMQKNGKLCRQADALIVGGGTVKELHENLEMVFTRLRRCNMTIKPSKLVIAPRSTTLFGWEFSQQAWRPSKHTINPLQVATPPSTVKQMRSWLGAAKQLSSGLKDYAKIFHPLEQEAAGKASADKILWSETLEKAFQSAKQLLATMQDIYYPLPEDKLYTYSDFAQDSMAVGGRLEIVRQFQDGSSKVLHGGFFSACLNATQRKWLPCEAECLGVKLVLEHFASKLRESKHQVTHYCDNMPTVLAYQRLKQGKFSASPRIAAFLTSVNTFNVNIVHKAGRDITLTDYISRNPPICSTKRCQVCAYVDEQVQIGDAIVHKISVQDILNEKYKMPYVQPAAWSKLQKKDPILAQLTKLINVGQKPEPKQTGGDFTILKSLYNHFSKGNLKINSAGLITLHQPDDSNTMRNLIVVPNNLFPGLVTSLHLKLQHPTKYQLNKIIGRYFYCPNSAAMVSECVDNCYTCIALKPMPPVIFFQKIPPSLKYLVPVFQ